MTILRLTTITAFTACGFCLVVLGAWYAAAGAFGVAVGLLGSSHR